LVALITIFPAEAEKMLLVLTLITYLLLLIICSFVGLLESLLRHKYPSESSVPILLGSLQFDANSTTLLRLDLFASKE